MKRLSLLIYLLIAPALALAADWPTDNITTTNLDSPTDDPSQARAEIYTGLLRVKDVIAARGSASGVASLDATSKIPLAQLPTGSGGVQSYDSDLAGVASLSANGIVARTGTGTFSTRALGVGTGLSISNGDGVAGDLSLSVSGNLQTWSGKTPPAGTVAGTTDTQNLTNKTLTAPNISAPVLSGTITGTYTLGGTPTFPSTVVSTTGTQTLTNKTLTAPVLGGTVTGTYTLGGTPTFPATVVTTTGTQTLTDKTLTSPTVNGGAVNASTLTVTARVGAMQGLGIYGGMINDSGTVIALPSGWSSVRNSTGNYTVTHNLGSAGYVVVGTVQAASVATDERIFQLINRGTNSFSYTTRGGSGGFADQVAHFILYYY